MPPPHKGLHRNDKLSASLPLLSTHHFLLITLSAFRIIPSESAVDGNDLVEQEGGTIVQNKTALAGFGCRLQVGDGTAEPGEAFVVQDKGSGGALQAREQFLQLRVVLKSSALVQCG